MKKIKLTSSSFLNLEKAFVNLNRSIQTPITEPRDVSGIIKDFEMVYELSWKVIKKYLESEGIQTAGPKDVFTKAYKSGYINQEAQWLSMIEDRNQAAHVYNEQDALNIISRIRSDYVNLIKNSFDI